jgi:hypothetical protein
MKIHLVTLCLFALAMLCYTLMYSDMAYALGGLGMLIETAAWISLFSDNRGKKGAAEDRK